jgi:cell division initiation protein
MALTPVEIRHIKLGRALLGYKRAAADAVLDEIAQSFEDVWRERADLADRVEQLEADLVRYRELESLLRTTLVSAERTSAELKEQAHRESRLILEEAHAQSRSILHGAMAERERLDVESRQIRERLQLALAAVEDGNAREAA